MPAKILIVVLGMLASIGLLPVAAHAEVVTTVTASVSNQTRPGQPLREGIDFALITVKVTNSDGSSPMGTIVARQGDREFSPVFSSTWPVTQPLGPLTTASKTITVDFFQHTGSVNTVPAASTTAPVDVVPFVLNPPAAARVSISINTGSSVSRRDAFVINKDTATLTGGAYWDDAGTMRPITEGTIKWYDNGVLIKTQTLGTNDLGLVNIGPLPTAGKHQIKAEYVPTTNSNFAAGSAERTVEFIEPQLVGDALYTFFSNFVSCWAKFWLTLFGNGAEGLFNCPWF